MYRTNHQQFAALILLLCVTLFSGCSTKDMAMSYNDPQDPWEGVNRNIFAFNETVDSFTFKPIAQAYKTVMPMFIRNRISNFFSNLQDLPTAANNLLQGKPGDTLNDLARVAINSTIGFFGTFDVASGMGLEKDYENFGQTLGVWGVPEGPYVVLPLLGSSTVRNSAGVVVDYLQPIQYESDSARDRNALLMGSAIVARAEFLNKEPIIRELATDDDFYSVVKTFYLTRMQSEVNDGAVGDDIYDQAIE